MALKPCKECGKDVSTQAKTCPHCGVDAPAQKGTQVSSGAGCFILLLVIFILAISGVFSGDNTSVTPPSSESSGFIDIKVQVRFTGTQFEITNRDSYNWKSVKLELNSGLIRGGYVYRVQQLGVLDPETEPNLHYLRLRLSGISPSICA